MNKTVRSILEIIAAKDRDKKIEGTDSVLISK